MKITLSPRNIAAIERCLNLHAKTEVLVKVEDGRVVVVMLERKKVG